MLHTFVYGIMADDKNEMWSAESIGDGLKMRLKKLSNIEDRDRETSSESVG